MISSNEPSQAYGARWALMAALYVAALFLDRSLVFFAAQFSAIPLAGGIAFIIVFRLGMPSAAMVFLLSFAVSLWSGAVPLDAIVRSSFDTVNAILGVVLLRKVAGAQAPFGGTKVVFYFFLLGAAVPVLLTSGMGQILANFTQFSVPDGYLVWWLGGTVGCILGAPLLATLSKWQVHGWGLFETVALLAASALLAFSFAGKTDLADAEFPLQYLIFPLLLWAVFRKGLGLAAVILVISITATLWGTTKGFGPFLRDSVAETSLLLQAFFGVTGVTVLILHAARDALEFQVAERTADLQVAMREADEANKTKSRFLAAASHDLRQPIHAISLFSTALQTRLGKSESAKLVSKVQGSLGSLTSMLDGLLDMSRIENHAVVVQQRVFPAQAILVEILTEHGAAAKAKNLDFRIVPSSIILKTDKALLSRIVGNVVGNAIRYTDHGRVLVGFRMNGDKVRLEVWDTGKGMSATDVDHIFDPYHRLDGARRHSADGLGLGLAIADGLAQLLGCQISVQSVLGKGSKLSIEIPRGAEAIDAIDGSVAKTSYGGDFNGYTVLAVDDDPVVLDGMKTVLSDWGCQVVVARNVQEALQKVQDLEGEVDVVISDYHLSDHDTGIALMGRINKEMGRAVPGIIISGDTQQERRHEVEAAGYFLLTKPVQPVSLRPLLRRQLNKTL